MTTFIECLCIRVLAKLAVAWFGTKFRASQVVAAPSTLLLTLKCEFNLISQNNVLQRYSQEPSNSTTTSIGDKWLRKKVKFNLPVSMDVHIAADILSAHRNAYIFSCMAHTQCRTNLDMNGRISTFWCIFPRNWRERL